MSRFNQEAYISFTESSAFTGDTSIQGFNAISRQRNEQHQLRVAEAAIFLSKILSGKEDPWMLRQALQPTKEIAWQALSREYPHAFRETMTTSDFSALTADVLDRLLLANYTEQPAMWMQLAKKSTLRDFRTVKRFAINGGETEFQPVAELADFERRAVSQVSYTYSPKKYEAGFALSWEDIINDDLGIFRDLVDRLARGGRRTIDKFVTRLIVDVNGPHASLFTTANKNIVNTTNGASATNPPLSVAGMQDGLTVLFNQVDSDGEPIEVEGIHLMVGPALYNTAQNLKNIELYDVNAIGGTSTQRARVTNWIMQGIDVVKNPQMRLIATSASGSIKDTQWYLFADPSKNRPVIEVGFLAGYDTPQLYEKTGNTQRVGGGVEQMLGDFNTMSKEMKAMLVLGGTQLDGRGAVSSTGANA